MAPGGGSAAALSGEVSLLHCRVSEQQGKQEQLQAGALKGEQGAPLRTSINATDRTFLVEAFAPDHKRLILPASVHHARSPAASTFATTSALVESSID
jgi:hypothetical protein